MKVFLAFFVPIVRLLGHQIAAAACFAAVAFISIIPFLIVQAFRWTNELSEFLVVFALLEKMVFYTDIGLYCITFVFSVVIFLLEEFRALKKIWFNLEKGDD